MSSKDEQLAIIKTCVTSLNTEESAPKYFLYFMTSDADNIFTTSSNNTIDDPSTLLLSKLTSYNAAGIEASITGKILKELQDNYGKHQTPSTPIPLTEDQAVDNYFNETTIEDIIAKTPLLKDNGSTADSTDLKDTLLDATNKNATTNRAAIIAHLKSIGKLTGGSSRSRKHRRRHKRRHNTKRRSRK